MRKWKGNWGGRTTTVGTLELDSMQYTHFFKLLKTECTARRYAFKRRKKVGYKMIARLDKNDRRPIAENACCADMSASTTDELALRWSEAH